MMNVVSNDLIIIVMCLIFNCGVKTSKSEVNKTTLNFTQNSTAAGNQKPDSATKTGSSAATTISADSKECVVRVIEIIDGEEQLIPYDATRIEVEREGMEFFDEICDDDPEWNRVISNNSLCSLVEARKCDFQKKSGNFKDKVKKIPKKIKN
uniref:Calcium/calmodulin-dependent protein kinase type II subunit alpha n=1 Tax=Lygus hesperus TaxID=30085 RepID=A0A0A9YGW4_LYGHE